ncbi:FAD-dependent oxidoreductase [Zavarzinia sp. CC-PAN008]|uniref:FAD-dependent oxidoreductase n=1 Tax=Zavarzinia sp. CC-PAN008 TaxID=3243332 RepID=UPI003F746D3E
MEDRTEELPTLPGDMRPGGAFGPRVVVIGAGIAGLSAARALARHGLQVTVLEARDRLGGRIWTRDGFDLGAHWIHGTEGNPVAQIANELGAPMMFVGGDSTYVGGWDSLCLIDRGRVLDPAAKAAAIARVDELMDQLEEAQATLDTTGRLDITVADAIETLVDLDSETPDARRALAWHLAVHFRDGAMAEPRELSFLALDKGYEVYGQGDSVLPDGFQSLVELLAEGLDIRLGEPVETIRHGQRDEPVQVVTERETFEAERVIVTVPLGVLKANGICFDPPIPDERRQAIDRLYVGALETLVIRLQDPVPQARRYAFGLMDGGREDLPSIVVNLTKTHGTPALMCKVGGDAAVHLAGLSEDATKRYAARVVSELFGDEAPGIAGVVRTGWLTDPYARGSGTVIGPDASAEHVHALSVPLDGRIHFAGEHTEHRHWGSVHGAYESGLREAARIAGDLSILPAVTGGEQRRWRRMANRVNRQLTCRTRELDRGALVDRMDVLRDSHLFGTLGARDLEEVAALVRNTYYEPGDVICRIGETATSMFVVADGHVRVDWPTETQHSTLHGRGELFGEYGFFRGRKRSATVTAATPVSLLELDYWRFHAFIMTHPDVYQALMGATVERLLAVQQTLNT